MQGMQFTATSTVAENQTLSFPMYIHSIPSNNDNQDIVSMGCNAALMTRKVINNSFEVLGIQAMTIVQAIDYLGCDDRLAPNTLPLYRDVRKIFPKFIDDSPKYKDLEKVKSFLEGTDPAILIKAVAFT
jgi:histidine ammonia-lyase